MQQTENEEVDQHRIYCTECKNPILDTEESHRNRKKDYHKFCWEQLTGQVEELKF